MREPYDSAYYTRRGILPGHTVESWLVRAKGTRTNRCTSRRTYKLGEEILTPFGRQQLCESFVSAPPVALISLPQTTSASPCA